MSSFKYTPENEAKFQEYASRYPKIDSCMLPALWLVQEQERLGKPRSYGLCSRKKFKKVQCKYMKWQLFIQCLT